MKFKAVFMSLFCVSISLARTGPGTGGGGFAVTCSKTPFEATSTVVLDLFEAEVAHGLKLRKSLGSIESDYFESVDRTYSLQGMPDLAERLKSEIQNSLRNFFRSIKFVDDESQLPPAHDLGDVGRIPVQCELQQVAYFDDQTDTVYLLRPIWNRLDSMNQAALVQHELFYKANRHLGDHNSIHTRLLVAQIFAENSFPAIDHGVDPVSSRIHGTEVGPLSIFYVTNGTVASKSKIRIQFQQLFGRPLLSKTWIDIVASPWRLRPVMRSPRPSCVVDEPGKHDIQTVPVQGFAGKKLFVRYEYVTGQKIKLSLINEGLTIAQDYLRFSNNCLGSRIK